MNYLNLYGNSAAALASNAAAYASVATNNDAFAVADYYQSTGTNWVTGYNLGVNGIAGPFLNADDPFVEAYGKVANLIKTPVDLAGYLPSGSTPTAQFNNGWFYAGQDSLNGFSLSPTWTSTIGTNIQCGFITK